MSKITQDISILRQKSENVTLVDEAKDLISKLEAELDKLDNGIGLAAIQLGYNKKVSVIRDNDGTYFHLINPELVEGLDEFIYFNEGCLSFPGLFRNTKRYKQITIKHQVIRDNKFEDETFVSYYSNEKDEPGNNGLFTIAVQHELDHFDSKLLIDSDIKTEPIKRDVKKVGRNEPCPCGKVDSSGKRLKFKKCCGK
jgi:peptide deformylase